MFFTINNICLLQRQNRNFQNGDGIIISAHLDHGIQNACSIDFLGPGACLNFLSNIFCLFLCSVGRFYSILYSVHFVLSWNLDNSKIWTTESNSPGWISFRRFFLRYIVCKKFGPAICNLQRTLWTSRMRLGNGL